MAVTVSNVPIKVYITNVKTNTAHPIGGVLTEDQQQIIDDAKAIVDDVLLKNSEDTQTVNSNTEFTNPVKGVNSEEPQPTELATVQYVNGVKTAIECELKEINSVIDGLPEDLANIAMLNEEQEFTEKQHFKEGLTTLSYEDPWTTDDYSVLNKADVLTLINGSTGSSSSSSASIHMVTALPDESEMRAGSVYFTTYD